MNYKSKYTLLGLPLVHVTTGEGKVVDGRYQRSIARGWVAIGDEFAFGILFSTGAFAFGGIAVGSVACGALAVGGVGVGLFALAGLAVAAYAIGGLAVGIIALGGCAVAWHAALGGFAVAVNYAVGGQAIAAHANDATAQQYMDTSIVQYGKTVLDLSTRYGHWIWLVFWLVFLPLLVVTLVRRRR